MRSDEPDNEPVESYTPIAEKLIGSSVWLHPDPALLRVWLVMIVEAWKPRSKGQVKLSIAGLAHKAVVSVEDAKRCIDILRAPDPDSRNDREEGRRIECLNPNNPYNVGWKLLNWGEFHHEFRRANNAAAAQKYRRRKKDDDHITSFIVTKRHHASSERHPDPSPDPDPSPVLKKREEKRSVAHSVFHPPGLEEIRRFVEDEHLRMDPEDFYLHFEANGWLVGGKTPMKSWRASVKQWAKREPDFKPEKSREWKGNNPEDEERKIAAMYYGDDGEKKP